MLGITTPRYDIGKDAAGHLDGDLDCSGDEKTSMTLMTHTEAHGDEDDDDGDDGGGS